MNVKNTTKHSLKVIGVMIMIISVVTVAPINYLSMGDNSPVGEAEGLVVTTTGGALVAGAAVVSGATYVATKYFSDSNEEVVKTLNKTKDNATNESLREATHQTAIISSGTSESYLDSTDNTLNTVEGSIRQRVGLRFIKVFDDENKTNITSETEAVTEGTDAAGTFLNVTQRNLLTTTNFQSYSVKQLQNNLELAGYGSDMVAGEKFKVSTATEFNTATDTNGAIIILDDNIGNGQNLYYGNDTVIIGNGNKINGGLSNKGRGQNATFVDINITDELSVGSGYVNTIGVETPQISFYSSGANGYKSYQGYYNESSEIGTVYNAYTEYDEMNKNALNTISFNASEIANNNANYNNASEVPKVTFNNEGENITLPAKTLSVDKSYYGSSTAKMGVPYVKDSSGSYVELGDNETVIVKTSTSGITKYTEPLNYPRATQLSKDLDNIGSTAYTKAETYSRDLWNAYLKDIVNNDNETIFNASTGAVDPELATLQYDPPKAGNTEAVINSYVGTFEGTTKPLDDTFKIKDIDENVTYTGALFSSNMTALMEQTNNTSIVEAGDTFNASVNGTKTFVVSDNGGSHELKGDVKIKSVINQDSADVRTYDQDSTNLSDQADRLQDQKKVIEKTIINEAGGGIGSIFNGNNGAILLVVGLLVLVAISGGKD